jgi:hypothetical protein
MFPGYTLGALCVISAFLLIAHHGDPPRSTAFRIDFNDPSWGFTWGFETPQDCHPFFSNGSLTCSRGGVSKYKGDEVGSGSDGSHNLSLSPKAGFVVLLVRTDGHDFVVGYAIKDNPSPEHTPDLVVPAIGKGDLFIVDAAAYIHAEDAS